jgi:hypothetical protein
MATDETTTQLRCPYAVSQDCDFQTDTDADMESHVLAFHGQHRTDDQNILRIMRAFNGLPSLGANLRCSKGRKIVGTERMTLDDVAHNLESLVTLFAKLQASAEENRRLLAVYDGWMDTAREFVAVLKVTDVSASVREALKGI